MPDPEKLIHNERLKLTAAWLNMLSGASIAAGVIAPLVVRFYGVPSSTVPATLLYLGAALWFFGGIALHLTARRLLGKLRDD